jgi:arylsulfatase A-like enzyme
MSKNIIFITADQLAASYVGCYGSGINSTPQLDELAKNGMRFERCYTTAPACAPNRATFLTGRSPGIHGIISNNFALATDTPTYVTVLREHGYRTGGFGKFHQTPMYLPEPETVDFLGFDESVVTEDPKWGPWLQWIKEEHPTYYRTALAMCWNYGDRPFDEAFINEWQTAKRDILMPLKEQSDWSGMYPSPLPAELHDTTFITNKSIDFINRHMTQHPNKPFFCHVSYVDPHDPYDPPAPYHTLYNPEEMADPLPAEWIEDGITALDKNRDYVNFRSICDNPAAIKKWRALFHGSLKFLDDQIARIIHFLKEKDLFENTIVIFTTDHGEMMGDHGLIAKAMPHYDNSIRCPLIVSGGNIMPGITDRLTCTLDFYPSICEFAGIVPDQIPPLEGKSFAGVCIGQQEKHPWEEVAVILGEATTVITDDGWRLTRYIESNEAQMFNLKKDPNELSNLYKHPDYAAKREELLERLIAISTRPYRMVNYRNLPIVNKMKEIPKGTRRFPIYPVNPSPYL